jgi:hypothetical protein
MSRAVAWRPSVGFDAVARLFGNHRGSNDPADVVFFGQITREPIPTRAGFRDKEKVFGLRLELPKQGVDITLPGAKGPEGDDLSAMFLRHIGDRDGLFMHIHADVERARL